MPDSTPTKHGGGKRATLQSLAEHLGLSKTTVSVVVSDAPAAQSIPLETRERILKAATALQYRPNYLARSLRRSSSMSVGILAPELSEGYFTLVMNGIEQYLRSSEYFYSLVTHNWKMNLVEQDVRLLQERAVDGFILIDTPPLPSDRWQVPVVAVSGHASVKNVTNIQLDQRRAAELGLQHLYQLGHRKIAFMRGAQFSSDADERWESITEVARTLGLEICPHLCIDLEHNQWSPRLGYDPVRDLLTRTRDFTAIFCFNDVSAVGAIRALCDVGLRVPDDVSVIGFDDVIGASYGIPSLTTVHQPLLEMGRLAAKTLLDRIANPSDPYESLIMMEPTLVVRESTAAPGKRSDL